MPSADAQRRLQPRVQTLHQVRGDVPRAVVVEQEADQGAQHHGGGDGGIAGVEVARGRALLDEHAQPGVDGFGDAVVEAQKAIQASLHGNVPLAQEIVLQLRNALKRQSGDLPIVSYEQRQTSTSSQGRAFLTRSFAETQAWGWLELAAGIVQVVISVLEAA